MTKVKKEIQAHAKCHRAGEQREGEQGGRAVASGLELGGHTEGLQGWGWGCSRQEQHELRHLGPKKMRLPLRTSQSHERGKDPC